MSGPPGIVLGSAWSRLRDAFGTLAAAGLIALLIALPLVPNLVPAALVTFLIGLLVHHRGNLRWRGRGTWRTPLPWMALYFLLHVLGMAWTEDLGFGLFDLQIKAPLLVLPLAGMFLPAFPRMARDTALFMGALACGLAVLFYLAAVVVRIAMGDGHEVAQEVFSARFSFVVHPSYLALYLVFAMAAWVLTPIHAWLPGWAGRLLLVFLCLGVVLCGSKMGWVLLLLVLPATLVLRWREAALRRTLLGLAGISVAALVLLVVFSPYARSRVQEAFRAALAERVDDHAETSSAVRRITWAAATTLIAERPLAGTGTGDIKNELLRLYRERGQDWVLERRLNAHSQFLQSAACLGVMGGLLLVAMLVVPFFGAWRRDALAVLFLLACALNWAVESMLEVQAGVVWAALMAVLLFSSSPEEASPSQPPRP